MGTCMHSKDSSANEKTNAHSFYIFFYFIWMSKEKKNQRKLKVHLVALPITSPVAQSFRIQSRLVPILPSLWHHVSISTTSLLYHMPTVFIVQRKYKKSKISKLAMSSKRKADSPSRVFIYFNVHTGRHPYKMQLSHSGGCCKSIC